MIFILFTRFYEVFHRVKKSKQRYGNNDGHNKPVPVAFRAGTMSEVLCYFRLSQLAGITGIRKLRDQQKP